MLNSKEKFLERPHTEYSRSIKSHKITIKVKSNIKKLIEYFGKDFIVLSFMTLISSIPLGFYVIDNCMDIAHFFNPNIVLPDSCIAPSKWSLIGKFMYILGIDLVFLFYFYIKYFSVRNGD